MREVKSEIIEDFESKTDLDIYIREHNVTEYEVIEQNAAEDILAEYLNLSDYGFEIAIADTLTRYAKRPNLKAPDPRGFFIYQILRRYRRRPWSLPLSVTRYRRRRPDWPHHSSSRPELYLGF